MSGGRRGPRKRRERSVGICLLVLLGVGFILAPGPARAVEAGILVLPVGESSPDLDVILAELKLGFDSSLDTSREPPRFRAMVSPAQLTGDLALMSFLGRVGDLYGMAEEQRRELVDRIQRLPIKEGDFRALLRVLVSRSGGVLALRLELADLTETSFKVVLSKSLEGPDVRSLRPQLRKVGRLVLHQKDPGGRPSPHLVSAVDRPRVGKEVTVQVRQLQDPEFDTFDWAWCLAAAPPTSEAPLGGLWHDNNEPITFTPDREGRYTVLLWSAETMRGEFDPPPCQADSPGARLTVEVGPTTRLSGFALGGYDLGYKEGVSMGTVAVRLGLEYLVSGPFGVRVAFDLLQGVFGSQAAPTRAGGALVAGVGWRLRLDREARLTPHLSLYGQQRESFARPHLGVGLGADLRLPFWRSIDLMLSMDGYLVSDLQRERDRGYVRLRAAAGLVRSF